MGIYIIKSVHSDWIKVGHHKITARRPNPYFRYINRGFYACKCPGEIKDRVSFEDLELIKFFPALDIKVEKEIHKKLRNMFGQYGEWYKSGYTENILAIIETEYRGVNKMPTIEDLNIAKEFCERIKKRQTSFIEN
jgi:hypothetical protein